MTDAHEDRCDQLSKEAVDFITSRVPLLHSLGYRSTTEFENAIYAWLIDHADFDEDEDD